LTLLQQRSSIPMALSKTSPTSWASSRPASPGICSVSRHSSKTGRPKPVSGAETCRNRTP